MDNDIGYESITVKYYYSRRDHTYQDLENGHLTARPEINIIDLGLIAPEGRQVGASGSDKTGILSSARPRPPPATGPAASCPGDGSSWSVRTRCSRRGWTSVLR